jgi:PEP-CTERM motif
MAKHLSTAALVAAGALTFASSAYATTQVATISGSYDLLYYDTPALTFHNTSGGVLANASMILQGYQPGTLNFGALETINLGTLGLGDTNAIWGFLPGGTSGPGSLSAYDYDDSWGNTPSGYTNPNCVVGGSLCSLVGNFRVIFNATVVGGAFNGDAVTSVFSPTSNYTGGFVGWEGLDPTGLSETIYDQHQGSITGTLAVITLGTSGVPEPSTWAMMLVGFAGLGFTAFRTKKAVSAASAI